MELGDKFGDEWEWVLILDHHGVQGTIILH